MTSDLIVVDVQKGFFDPRWGRRSNPASEENIEALVLGWRQRGQPLVFVRHDSADRGSPFAPGTAGNELQDFLTGEPDLLVRKSVHSSFHGDVDLEAWLRGNGIDGIVVCGIQTNFCAETTARVGSDLGFAMTFVLDATHTYELPGITAEEQARATAAVLAADFGDVVATRELLRR